MASFEELLQDETSYPYTLLYGVDGTGGLWKTRNVPAKYSEATLSNLPIQQENPKAYATVAKYIENAIKYVHDKKVGMFFYSKPTSQNKFGTGIGKTQAAITILNHYLLERVKLHCESKMELAENPVYFCKSTELQTAFNAQFRGTQEMQQKASVRYYAIKTRVMQVDLLVLDDVATKSATEAYMEELYEIIDHRATEELATIFTSNVPLVEVAEMLGDRVASRIEGMTVPVEFTGKDHRKKVL